ncbi:hypothetical protein [Chondromyces apiculatus]|nr:hypothetical protein [Chondromyces apiculatus]
MKIMKANLVLTALALAATAVATNVGATQLNSNGSAFQPYNASQATVIDYFGTGVRTIASTPTYVVASVDHNPSTSGQTVFIDGTHSGSQTTTCSVLSYNYNGTILSSQSVNATAVSGAWERSVRFTPAQSTNWAYFSVLCLLPANGAGVLLGVAAS